MDTNGSGWGPVLGYSEILGSHGIFLSATHIYLILKEESGSFSQNTLWSFNNAENPRI
jgi:hypothetical protein